MVELLVSICWQLAVTNGKPDVQHVCSTLLPTVLFSSARKVLFAILDRFAIKKC